MTAKTITETLVDNVLALDFATLPAAAVDMARQVTVDGLAVIIAGSTEPMGVGRMSIDYVRQMGGAPQASVITGGFKAAMHEAAYANGTMAHALDWDNTWYPLNHPTSPTLAAILAIAEYHRLPGTKIITAIVAAFEVQGRLRMAATGMNTGVGFHKPGMTGIFGAVAGAARMLDLDRNQTLMAFGIAGSRAGSMSLNTGTMTKSSHSGHAARMGVECAMLAGMGWTANADVFGPKGFFDTFMPGSQEPELLIKDFAAPLRMVDPGVGFKKHPSNYFTHRPIDGALALREEYGILPQQIERVEVTFPRMEYVDRPQPETGLDGKFSVQYTTAIALLDGVITVDSFTNERRYAADVVALLPRIALKMDDTIAADFDAMHIILQVWLKDGRHLTREVKKLSGWVGLPLTREQRLKKFFACTGRILEEKAAHRMLALAEQLDTLQDVTELMDIARCESGARRAGAAAQPTGGRVG